MSKPERKGQKEYAEGVKKDHKGLFGALFCRVCPKDTGGFDKDGKEIPLEAHHTSKPYIEDKNQDPSTGTLICRDGHQKQIHTKDRRLSDKGKELQKQFIKNPKTGRYDIGVECEYKDGDD